MVLKMQYGWQKKNENEPLRGRRNGSVAKHILPEDTSLISAPT